MVTAIDVKSLAKRAKNASFDIAKASTEQKNEALNAIARLLEEREGAILEANNLDITAGKNNGLNAALLERLSLEGKLKGIISDVKSVVTLEDPIGKKFDEKGLDNGLNLARYRTPIGVLGVIYESRPNVTIDISALAIKSGNCAILRGGSETLTTNIVLADLIQEALISVGLPKVAIQFIASSDRTHVMEMLHLHDYIDLIIPRGSASLQDFCKKNSTIPVITGGIGICHLFVDESADIKRSLEVILNAKTQRPTVCNALDTVLVHSSIAGALLPPLLSVLGEAGVSFRMDEKAFAMKSEGNCQLAEAKDWDTEWLSLVLGIKVVTSLDEAIEHIHLHSSGHSDGILTENVANADRFIKEVDSSAVYVNASTRFTDGAQFGFGAEVAISTQKIHARGPMGLNELTSYKWVVHGDYHVRK